MIQFVHVVNKPNPEQPKQEQPKKPKSIMKTILIIFALSILLGLSTFASIYRFEYYISVGFFYILLRERFIDAILIRDRILIVASHLLGLLTGVAIATLI